MMDDDDDDDDDDDGGVSDVLTYFLNAFNVWMCLNVCSSKDQDYSIVLEQRGEV